MSPPSTRSSRPLPPVSVDPGRGHVGRLSDPGVLTVVILVIAMVGTLEATYLTYIHYHGLASLPCFGKNSGHSTCEAVQSSRYAKLAGIPVALLGLLGYITILVTLFIRGELGRLAGFGVALIGFGFSMYLTYRELFTLKEICEWCVASACLMTALMVLTSVRYLRAA